MYPKVVIIILNWNGKEDSLKCLYSLKQLKYPNYEVLFVDNGSHDDSVACVSQGFSQVHIIENKKNLGFAEGNNVGIRWALRKNAEYIFLLNNDTIVDKYLMHHLIACGEGNPEAGILGPKVYYFESSRRFYSAGAEVNFREFVVKPRGYNEEDTGQFDDVTEVDFVVGCGLLIKRKVIEEIGLLDPIYFAYFEDVDWCVRARTKGYKTIFVPQGRMWHRVAASTGGSDNPRWTYLMGRGATIFVRKYGSPWDWAKFGTFLGAELAFGLIKKSFFGESKPIVAKLKGVKDGLFLNEVNPKSLENVR